MADVALEEKYKMLQQYVRSILPQLEKVQMLEEENNQLKISQSQELEHKRSVLETGYENLEKERATLKAEKDIMRKMKEKFEALMKDSKKRLEEEQSKKDKSIEEEKKLIQGETIKLMEEKNMVQVSTKKILEDRRLIEEERNKVREKLKSLEERENKLTKEAKIQSKAKEEFNREKEQNRLFYEEKARNLEEKRKDLDKEIEILEKESLYIDEDWKLINDWKITHDSSLDYETKDIELKPISIIDVQSLAIECNPPESEAPKRKRGRPRKDGGVTKKIKTEKVDFSFNEITLDPDFFADSPEDTSSTLDLHYQELLKIEKESTETESFNSNLSAKQLLEEVSLLL